MDTQSVDLATGVLVENPVLISSHRARCLRAVLSTVVVCSCWFPAPRTVGAQDNAELQALLGLEKALVRVVAKCEASVVSIARFKSVEAARKRVDFGQLRSPLDDPENPESLEFVPNDFGAGVIIAGPGGENQRFVLTNYHVVRGGPQTGTSGSEFRLHVRFANRSGCYATIRSADPRSDLAILDLDFQALGRPPADLPAVTLASARRYRKGQLVLSLGNPYAIARDGSATVSMGMISNVARRPAPVVTDLGSPDTSTIHHFGTLLQVDCRQNLGTSGGALLNLRGELVGVTTAMAALDGYEKSVGYAIPIDTFSRRVIGELASGFEVEYGFLGIQTTHVHPSRLPDVRRRFLQSSAPMVESVLPNSAAAAGKLERGDVILSVNQHPVFAPYDLIREVGRVGPGKSVQLRVWRAQASPDELNLAVILGKWPVEDDMGIIATRSRRPVVRGLSVDYPTARRKFLQGLEFLDAVLVLSVADGSPADASDLAPGDFVSHVNGERVATPQQFHTEMSKHSGPVMLQVIDHGGPVRMLTLPPGD